MIQATNAMYNGVALIADPIHGYIKFTVPSFDKKEKTEKAIIDTPWVQRLRRIRQLQSAGWVFPSAEHSRFQHVLGAMHVAGEFAKHLYPSLKEVIKELPSECFIEEFLRLTGLLHDIGHGPFGHFFDDNFLAKLDLTHEKLGKLIITKELSDLIKKVKRSPSGCFSEKEVIQPEHIGYMILKEDTDDKKIPKWVKFLKPLFSGIYTADNLDYVQRDAFITGFSIDIIDVKRLLYYTFFTDQGLTLHKTGVGAFHRFLNARIYLYSNVYYHRTARAIDLHMQEIFGKTMNELFKGNPAENLKDYLKLTDWYLINEVEKWIGLAGKKGALGREWQRILNRDVKWKMAFDYELSMSKFEKGLGIHDEAGFEAGIRKNLPERIKDCIFKVDAASQDPRPENPFAEGSKKINIYNPSTGTVSVEPLLDILKNIPAKVIKYRVFAPDHRYDREISSAAIKFLESPHMEGIKTNV